MKLAWSSAAIEKSAVPAAEIAFQRAGGAAAAEEA
jgi:hypothetical protein